MESAEVDELVEAARSGDHGAFEELVRQTYTDTYTLALRLVGDEEDARDVVQETYLRVHKGLKKFRGEARFSTWLHRITANCANTYLGRRGRHQHEPLPEEPVVASVQSADDPEESVRVRGLRDELSLAVHALPPKLRAVLVLRDVYGLPHNEIAEQLEITESAAKVRLHRARKRLREQLYPLGHEEQVRAM